MFERFTDRARRTVVQAQEEARRLKHNYIGTEHILLALVHEGEGVAARTIESLGISLQELRDNVEARVGEGTEAKQGHIPFTPRAKRVLELSLREALQLNCDYIGTEHILLGLVREDEGPAARALAELGLTLDRARQRVTELVGPRTPDPERAAKRSSTRRSLVSTAQIEMLIERVAAVERWSGLVPGLADIDEQIAHVRRDKESAIERQDFETAAARREEEKTLLSSRAARASELASAPTLADDLRQLRDEVARLRAIMREHGIEPGGAA